MPSSFSTLRAALFCSAALLGVRCLVAAQAQPALRPAAGKNLRGWRVFSSGAGAFSVFFPGAPQSKVRAEGKHKVHTFYHAVPGAAYIVSYGDLREAGFSTQRIQALEAQGMLDSTLKGMLQGSHGVLVSQRRLQRQDFPAREVVYDIPQLGIRSRGMLVYARPFLYQVFALVPKKQAASPQSAAKVRAFLDSFQTRAPRQ